MGNRTWPPPGSCTPVCATAIRDASRPAGPKPAPMASTCRGRAADSAAIAAGSARGSSPRTAITRTPATRAVVTAASVAASLSPECTSSARWLSGAGAFVAGSIAGSVTTRMPGSAAASTLPATPTASTARGSSALICARSMALTTALRTACRPAPRSAAAAHVTAGPTGRRSPAQPGRSATGDNDHRRGDEQSAGHALGDHIGSASQHRRRRTQARGYARPGGPQFAGHAGQHHRRTSCRHQRLPPPRTPRPHAPSRRGPYQPAGPARGTQPVRTQPIRHESRSPLRGECPVHSVRPAEHIGRYTQSAGFSMRRAAGQPHKRLPGLRTAEDNRKLPRPLSGCGTDRPSADHRPHPRRQSTPRAERK